MKIYIIYVNDRIRPARASCARVAVARALQGLAESEIVGGKIQILSSRKIEYQYVFKASVPCDPPGSRKEATVGEPFATLNEAEMAIDGFRDAHQTQYTYVRIQRVEKQP